MTGPKRAPIYRPDCIEIVLTRGYSTFVDLDCPADILARNWCARPWCASKTAGVYVVTTVREGGIQSKRYLHRMLLGDAATGMEIDHVDRDPLNNRRSNLRVCTRQQNAANQSGRTGFRGVDWHKVCQKWRAQLTWRDTSKGKRRYKHVGHYDTAEEAARAWDAAALASGHYDLDFLQLNFPTA